MTNTARSFLGLLIVLSTLITVSLIIAMIVIMIGVVFTMGASALSPDILTGFLSDLGMGHADFMTAAISIFSLLLVLGVLAIISFAIVRISSNARANQYFCEENVRYFQLIFYGFSVLVVLYIAGSVLNISDSGLFSLDGDSQGTWGIFWMVSYLAYVFVKHGAEVRE